MGTDYVYDARLTPSLLALRQRVDRMRDQVGALSPDFAPQLRQIFRLKNIYETNAIEGSTLTIGETRLVVMEGLTISGKPLEDTLAAKNLSFALDYFEGLAKRDGDPIKAHDIRQIHQAILQEIDDQNAGKYRVNDVAISGSKYKPPTSEKVPGLMRDFHDWLAKVSDPTQRHDMDPLALACAAHAWFVYIHPFVDGNGRTARLLMNLILVRNGYPLTIITKDDRLRYYDALEESQASDLTPLIGLVLEEAQDSMDIYEQAAQEQANLGQFARDMVAVQERKADAEYQVYSIAMELLKTIFRQVADMLNEQMQQKLLPKSVFFKDFGTLESEKYQVLKQTQSAKRTWFFRLTFPSDADALRFVFYFGFASAEMSRALGKNHVTLHVSTETEPFFYTRLSDLPAEGYPDLHEIGYLASEERFICLKADGKTINLRAEEIAREFIQQVFDRSLG